MSNARGTYSRTLYIKEGTRCRDAAYVGELAMYKFTVSSTHRLPIDGAFQSA